MNLLAVDAVVLDRYGELFPRGSPVAPQLFGHFRRPARFSRFLDHFHNVVDANLNVAAHTIGMGIEQIRLGNPETFNPHAECIVVESVAIGNYKVRSFVSNPRRRVRRQSAMTETEDDAGREARTDDDEPAAHQTNDVQDLTPTETHRVEVPVAVPPDVEQDARRRAERLGGSFEDALLDHVTLDHQWVFSDESRGEVVHLRLSSETAAAIEDASNGDTEAWILGLVNLELADRAPTDHGSATGGSFAGPSGVPEDDVR